MNKKCRLLWKISLIAVVSGVLSSCSPAVEVSIPKTEKETDTIKLRFISSWGGVDSKTETLQRILDDFEKNNSEIEIVNESIFGDDFLPKLKVDFASGNDPDVFGLWPGSDINALVKVGKVADLTNILKADPKWKDSFGSTMWRHTRFQDHIYGLPVEIIFECLFINTDLFEKYKVKVPTSYQELKQAVTIFRKNHIVPIAYNSLAEGSFLYQNIVAVLGGRDAVESPQKDGSVQQCFIDGMKYMQELYGLGAFSKNSFTMTSSERNELFKQKKAAMLVQGSWFIGDFKDNQAGVDIIPMPYFNEEDKDKVIYGLGCGTFHMSQNTANMNRTRDASIKLMKALTSKEASYMLAENTGMLSNINLEGYEPYYDKLTRKGMNIIFNAPENIGPPDSFLNRSVWEKVIVRQFPYMLEGKNTPEELWEKAMKEGIFGE